MESVLAGNDMQRLILLFSYCTASYAEVDGVRKCRDFTPDQIAALPDKARSAEVPMMYIFATNSAKAKGSEPLFAMQLN